MPVDVKKLAEDISKLSLVEVRELIDILESEYGIKAVAPVVAAASSDLGAPPTPGETKSTFNVKITGCSQESKVSCIKAIKDILGVGLSEAKSYVDKAPIVIKEGVSKEEAETIKKKLEEVKATVVLE